MTLDLNTVFSSYGIVILGVMAGMAILLIVVFILLINTTKVLPYHPSIIGKKRHSLFR